MSINNFFLPILFFCLFLLITPEPLKGQNSDSTKVVKVVRKIERIALDSTLMNESPKVFSPNSEKSIWFAALIPGLGQVYNRKYWKLPLIYGGFLGLYYGFNWNNQNYKDYSLAFQDISDDDPNTISYMDLMPPGTLESSVDKSWLKDIVKRRKDYYSRNRDLCIIGMVGFYALTIVDAYVDAQLFHFTISEDLSLRLAPSCIPQREIGASFGIQLALNF